MNTQMKIINNRPDYARLRTLLLRAVRSNCPPWLVHDAEDIAQNAMIKLHEKMRKSPDMIVNKSYLNRVAHSVLIDEIRYRRRRFEGHGEDAMGEDYEIESRLSHQDDGAIGNAVQDCLLKQQSRRRRALTLHLLGHTTQEVATLTGVKPKQAENLIYRALANLRDCLIKKEVYP